MADARGAFVSTTWPWPGERSLQPPPPDVVPDRTPQGVVLPDAVKPTKHPVEAIAAVTKAWAAKAAAQAAQSARAGLPSGGQPATGLDTANGPLGDKFRGAFNQPGDVNPSARPTNTFGTQPLSDMPPERLRSPFGDPGLVKPDPVSRGPGAFQTDRTAGPADSINAHAAAPQATPAMRGDTPPETLDIGGYDMPVQRGGGAFVADGPPSAAAADPSVTISADPGVGLDPGAALPPGALRSPTPVYDPMAVANGNAPAPAPMAAAPPARGGGFRGGGAAQPPAGGAASPLDGHDPAAVANTIAGTPAGQGLKQSPASAFSDAGFDEDGINKLYAELEKSSGHKGDQDLTSDDKAHIMMELGLSIMAAGGQHGATFLGAIGAGGLAAMGAYRQMKAEKKADAIASEAARRDVVKTGIDIKMKQGELRGKYLDAALTREQKALDAAALRDDRNYNQEQNRQLRRDMAAAAIAGRNPPAVDGRVQQVNDLVSRGMKQDDAIEKVYGAKDSPLKDLDSHLDAADKGRIAAGQDPMSPEERKAAAAGWIENRKAAAAALSGDAPPPGATPGAPPPAAGQPPVAGAVPWVQNGQKYWKSPDNKLYAYQ